jgi:hypothetical protein
MKTLITTLFISLISFSAFAATNLVDLSGEFLTRIKDKEDVEDIVKQLEATSLEDLTSGLDTENKKFAFWVNIYNGFIQYHLTKHPEYFEDRGDFFSKKRIKIAGETLAFADIEHGIIRKSQNPLLLGRWQRWFVPKWERKLRVHKRDWRIHFALNCGAKSCPPVAIYNDKDLDAQFDFMTQKYLEDFTTYDESTKTANVTSLFSWFRGDFGGKSGVKKILSDLKITSSKPKKLVYDTYDWTLLLGNFREIKL